MLLNFCILGGVNIVKRMAGVALKHDHNVSMGTVMSWKRNRAKPSEAEQSCLFYEEAFNVNSTLSERTYDGRTSSLASLAPRLSLDKL